MKDIPPTPLNTPAAEPGPGAEERKKTFARRALIQAGWVIPAVAIFGLPDKAGAASTHVDSGHIDGGTGFSDTVPHSDLQHIDIHNDGGVPHTDSIPHTDGGISTPHNDGP